MIIFNEPLTEIQNYLVITLLSLYDKRVSVYYGIGNNFRFDTALALDLVTKQRREFIKDGVQLLYTETVVQRCSVKRCS